ncbi:uncharacterized protein G2W53_008405 [Senna tora]|uniref:Uncharacterized protein n=1 Tax=Senna tora TaxID=362788 RepID=A0A834XA36_9FABA|nr:uncharacterized protein G2W53_008405 [Senna tora]
MKQGKTCGSDVAVGLGIFHESRGRVVMFWVLAGEGGGVRMEIRKGRDDDVED